ncbi:unnamed protein product, partial [Rotaria sordida]
KYDLIGVSNHIGGLDGGYYTVHAKTNINDYKCHSFDDSYVSDIDKNSVLYDLNNFPFNEHLLKNHHAFANNRYGDLTFCEQIEDDYNNQGHALFLV